MKTKEVDTSPIKRFEDDEEKEDSYSVKDGYVSIKLKVPIEIWEAYRRTIPINIKLTDGLIYLMEERIKKVENG